MVSFSWNDFEYDIFHSFPPSLDSSIKNDSLFKSVFIHLCFYIASPLNGGTTVNGLRLSFRDGVLDGPSQKVTDASDDTP